mmetsp:Transcript_22380/g.69272  ORF Transcript_22380/g.69272 Transcript_22380/m.69272 type:complete len:322 (+) Transcript_22380:764-1729(+)
MTSGSSKPASRSSSAVMPRIMSGVGLSASVSCFLKALACRSFSPSGSFMKSGTCFPLRRLSADAPGAARTSVGPSLDAARRAGLALGLASKNPRIIPVLGFEGATRVPLPLPLPLLPLALPFALGVPGTAAAEPFSFGFSTPLAWTLALRYLDAVGGGSYSPWRPAASANEKALASRLGPACSSAPPMRKTVSSPKHWRISPTRCSFMPPAGHGSAGMKRPMGLRQPSATAWHSSGVNLNRPPALGKMTTSAPTNRGSVPNKKSWAMPPASPPAPPSHPPSIAGCSSSGRPKLSSAASSRIVSKPVMPGSSMTAPAPFFLA